MTAAESFDNLDPQYRIFGEYLVTTIESSLGKRIEGLEQRIEGLEQRIEGLEQRIEGLEQRIEGLEQRLERMEQKLDQAIIATQANFGKMLTIETLLIVSIRIRPKEEIKNIKEVWDQISAFSQVEGPPAMREAAIENYNDIRGFLEKSVSEG